VYLDHGSTIQASLEAVKSESSARMPTVSPRIEVFAAFDGTTGDPLTGLTPAFTYYADDQNNAQSQPAITEIGGGLYMFTPAFSDAARGIVYVVDLGTSSNPRYYWRYVRNEDYDTDKLKTLLQIEAGKWQIHTTGPYENQLVFYDEDGTTVLYAFDLKDAAGGPTTSSPFRREPA
jgi:hypothetical protein